MVLIMTSFGALDLALALLLRKPSQAFDDGQITDNRPIKCKT